VQVKSVWGGTVAQTPEFGYATSQVPANASVVIPLDSGSVINDYYASPEPGDWLFACIGWHEGLDPVSIASVGDDLHGWWRPLPPSPAAGVTRTSVWYQPNLGAGQDLTAVPSTVYVAPTGYQAGMSVQIVDVAGLSAWDEVVAFGSAFQAASTSIALAASAYGAAVAADVPYAWWQLSDLAGTTSPADWSANEWTATASHVTFGGTPGPTPPLTFASFNGTTSGILTDLNPALDAVTVEAWVNLDGQTQAANTCLLGNSEPTVSSSGFVLQLFGGTTPTVFFGNGTTYTEVQAASAVCTTSWNHIAATWCAGVIILYVNGVAVAKGLLSGTLAAGSADVGVGYNPSYSGDYVNGQIAQAAIYPRALSAARIAAHYAAAATPAGITQSLSVADSLFGTWTGDWSAGTNTTVSQSAAEPFIGPYAMAMKSTSAGAVTGYGPQIPVTPGNCYAVSGWLYDGTRQGACGMAWYTSGGTQIGSNDLSAAASLLLAYAPVSHASIAPSGAAYMLPVLQATGLNASETCYASAITAGPIAEALVIGAVTGDNDTDAPTFDPAGWTSVATLDASNGYDHTSDTALATALTTTTSGPLHPNPYFTGGSSTGWVAYQGTLTVTGSPPAGCPYPYAAEYVSNGTSGGALEGSATPFSVPLSSAAGNWYPVSCWVYSVSATSVALGFDWDNSGGYLATTNQSFAIGASTWTLISTTQQAPATATSAYPRVGPVTASSGATIYAAGIVPSTGAAAFWPAATGTAGAAVNLSGVLLAVLPSSQSPVPAGQNSQWPCLAFEAAFGAGYQTTPDQMPWVPLLPDQTGWPRLREWGDETGTQYELDSIQTSETSLLLDNPDGQLTPDNTGSIFWPNCDPGTPVRLRGIPPPAANDNHWYVHQRYAERWPQSWDDLLRGEVNFTGNDPWNVVSKEVPTAYRAEVVADNPYSWWPCDDPLIIPQPTSLVNAAPGNSNPLLIETSPNGLSVGITSYPFTTDYYYSAAEAFAADSQWMYGDPDSAAWQQTGTGDATHGRYLAVNDTGLPQLAGGITVEAWVNLDYWKTGSGSIQGPYSQPNAPLILWQLGGSSNIVASLQASNGTTGEGGDLTLVTYNGSTPTYTPVYSSEDIRNQTWLGVIVALTTTGATVWMNGSLVYTWSTSTVTGTISWFTALGGGATAGEPGSGNIAGICNAAVSHISIYKGLLPPPRVMAHFMGAYTGFGQLPAPTISGQFIETNGATTYLPNGVTTTDHAFVTPGYSGDSNLAAVAVAAAGSFYSAPSSPECIVAVPSDTGSEQTGLMWLTAAAPAAPSYTWYAAEAAGNEELASTSFVNFQSINSYPSGATPPTAASSLGDTVQNRIERLLVAGIVPGLPRSIDAATSLVVAALDTGGQACGANITNIVSSDGGLLFTDNMSALCYWDKPHLAALTTMWTLGPDVAGGTIPYEPGPKWDTDPQRVLNDIEITQFNVAPDAVSADESGSGESQTIPGVTYSPAGSYWPAIQASQKQYGPKQVQNGSTSYLQSGTSIQDQANWLFATYGQAVTRIESLTVDAASKTRTCPQAWSFYWGAQVGHLVQVTRTFPGQPSITGIWMITHIERHLTRENGKVAASIEIQADIVPASYWS
jgi:Concanavalin A-like lectin/glucanases superfamily